MPLEGDRSEVPEDLDGPEIDLSFLQPGEDHGGPKDLAFPGKRNAVDRPEPGNCLEFPAGFLEDPFGDDLLQAPLHLLDLAADHDLPDVRRDLDRDPGEVLPEDLDDLRQERLDTEERPRAQGPRLDVGGAHDDDGTGREFMEVGADCGEDVGFGRHPGKFGRRPGEESLIGRYPPHLFFGDRLTGDVAEADDPVAGLRHLPGGDGVPSLPGLDRDFPGPCAGGK